MDLRFDQAALAEVLAGTEVQADLERRALRVERDAKRRVHVDTGRLRASLTHAAGRDSKGPYQDVGSNVEYALIHELDYPYLRPALDQAG